MILMNTFSEKYCHTQVQILKQLYHMNSLLKWISNTIYKKSFDVR